MVQTKIGSIGQLIKGCSLTDRPVMLLLSMMVMLMSIQVIFACHCKEIDWERVIREEENSTVLVAALLEDHKFEDADGVPIGTLHRMMMEDLAKDGYYLLPEIGYEFWMFTPHTCSASLENKVSYMIYGIQEQFGAFLANKCTVERYDDGFFNKTGRENLRKILWGDSGF